MFLTEAKLRLFLCLKFSKSGEELQFSQKMKNPQIKTPDFLTY